MATTVTCNVHVTQDTPIKAVRFDDYNNQFSSIQIGDVSVFLRGDDLPRLANVLNQHIAEQAVSA